MAVLREYVNDDERGNIVVMRSSPNKFRVIIGSDKFKSIGPAQRQDIVWKYLSDKVKPELVVYCTAVHPMDAEEFESTYLGPEGSSSSASPFSFSSEDEG
ncbi:MAG: hypothetical protein FLDDKLPJ_03705 [Phycisphaerae bacterium]|nr:hypothetical protein [Phycisphaerae bacterium]